MINYTLKRVNGEKIMTNKYYCQNGDLIEVGSDYIAYAEKLTVVGFHNDKVVIYCKEFVEEYLSYDVDEFKSLWQEPEQPDKDGWIKHTTGKQPVGGDVMVEVKLLDETLTSSRYFQPLTAETCDWEDVDTYGCITHYRIVEQPTNEENSAVNELEEIKKRLEKLESFNCLIHKAQEAIKE